MTKNRLNFSQKVRSTLFYALSQTGEHANLRGLRGDPKNPTTIKPSVFGKSIKNLTLRIERGIIT